VAREAARFSIEIVVLSAGSAREFLRSMVLLRRLQVRRAAVIYDTGCAALSGEERRFERARAELRLLDELIMAATARPTVAFRAAQPAAPELEPSPAGPPQPAATDVPTEESVLMPGGTATIPALKRGR
jgi:hypothetical protein